MQGLVLIEFIEMIDEVISPDVAERVIVLSGVKSGGAYTSIGNYDSSEFVAMINQLFTILGDDTPGFLADFGQRLFQRFYNKYPDQFANSNDPLALLQTFSSIYRDGVSRIHPEAKAPSTEFSRINDYALQVDYKAEIGMSHVTEGLILGVLDSLKTEAVLSRQLVGEGDNKWVRFTVTCRQSIAA